MINWKTIVRDVDWADEEEVGSGCSGSYYKVAPKLGIKLYDHDINRNYKKCVGSTAWWKASNAYHTMNIAAKHDLAPKAHGVTLVKKGANYYVALIMEHVSGYGEDGWSDRLEKKLKKIGLDHGDLGPQNVIKRRRDGKLVAIDFDYTRKIKK